MPAAATTRMIDRGDGVRLAARVTDGRSPCVLFLPGFGSDMTGEKVSALARLAAAHGHATLAFDYSGHGGSEGRFANGTIGRWRDDALHLLDTSTEGPVVLFGSSMGGWIALLVALARPGRIAGILGAAAAPDFTERRILPSLDVPQRECLARDGIVHVATGFSPAVPITRALLDDGRANALLARPGTLPIGCPVRLVEGQRDDTVAPGTALELAAKIAGEDVQVIVVKDGDHRLSRKQDVALLGRTLLALLD